MLLFLGWLLRPLPLPGPAFAGAETAANDADKRAMRRFRPHTAFFRVFGLYDKRFMMTQSIEQ